MNDERIFYDITDFPNFKQIEDNWEIIASEIPSFDIHGTYVRRDIHFPKDKPLKEIEEYILARRPSGFWLELFSSNRERYSFPLVYRDEIVSYARNLCPQTIRILSELMKTTNIAGAAFGLITPHNRMPSHKDGSPGFLASNMLLTDSPNVCVWVDNVMHPHVRGKMVIYNPLRIHRVNNDNDTNRVILNIEFGREFVPNRTQYHTIYLRESFT